LDLGLLKGLEEEVEKGKGKEPKWIKVER